MKVNLSTFNKGGVGKTTLAVHLAGALAEDPFQRVLLVDCVDQYDSVILDLNSPAKDTVKAIVNAQPTGVFLPINRQALALGETLIQDTHL